VPDGLAAEVEKAMAKDPTERHESAAALARALDAAADAPAEPTGRTTVVVPRVDAPRPPADEAVGAVEEDPAPRGSRVPLVVGLLLLGVLLAGTAGWWLLARDDGDDSTTSTAGDAVDQVDVPDVVGDPIRSAEAELRNAGFLVVVRLVHDEAPLDEVLDQDPAGGTAAQEGSSVTLQVSEGPEVVTVPDLVGEIGFGAADTLEELGLVTVFDEREDDEDAGIVVDQRPAPGAEVDAGAEVVVILSSGPPASGGGATGSGASTGAPVALPPVVGLAELDARAQLEGAGFVVEVVLDHSGSGELGKVTSQDPAGSVAPDGSTVTIIVAGLPGE
jgi:serine/threonine-protein kinase